MFGVTDADAMGGRPGLAAAPPIDTPQPAPARAGQARSPWPVPSTAPHAIAFEQYYYYYYDFTGASGVSPDHMILITNTKTLLLRFKTQSFQLGRGRGAEVAKL